MKMRIQISWKTKRIVSPRNCDVINSISNKSSILDSFFQANRRLMIKSPVVLFLLSLLLAPPPLPILKPISLTALHRMWMQNEGVLPTRSSTSASAASSKPKPYTVGRSANCCRPERLHRRSRGLVTRRSLHLKEMTSLLDLRLALWRVRPNRQLKLQPFLHA